MDVNAENDKSCKTRPARKIRDPMTGRCGEVVDVVSDPPTAWIRNVVMSDVTNI